MKLLDKLIKKPQIFQRTIGLSIEQFELLVKEATPIWIAAEIKRKTHENRKRKIGGGRSYKFESVEEMLFTTLFYYRAYITQELLGILVGLDQGNISRLLTKIRPLIEQAADPELATYLAKTKEEYLQQDPQQRVNDFDTFLKKYPDLKEAATDATEQRCFRSLDNEQQKKYYSGKKKQHSLKTQISVASTGRFLDVSHTYPGSVHDKKIIDEEKTIQKFPEKTCQRLDSGYQGIVAEHPKHYVITPIKKLRGDVLSPTAKDLNRVHSKRRVIAENALCRMKNSKILKHTYRAPLETYNQTFRNIAALTNFKLAHSNISQ